MLFLMLETMVTDEFYLKIFVYNLFLFANILLFFISLLMYL